MYANLRGRESRRRYQRLATPVFGVETKSGCGRTRDWSFGGVAVAFDDRIDHSVGDETELTLSYGPDGETGTFRARLTRLDSDTIGAYQFVGMSEGGIDLMAKALKQMAQESCRSLAYTWETTGRYAGERIPLNS